MAKLTSINDFFCTCKLLFGKVKTFQYVGSLLKNQNYIYEEIKCKLNSGNSYYFSAFSTSVEEFENKNI